MGHGIWKSISGSTIFSLTTGKIHQLRECQFPPLENKDDYSVAMRSKVIMGVEAQC